MFGFCSRLIDIVLKDIMQEWIGKKKHEKYESIRGKSSKAK
jgi:hypothetical protein